MTERLTRAVGAAAVLMGVLWAVRSIQSFADLEFTDPESVADWSSVASVSFALLLLPVGLVGLVEMQTAARRTTRALLPVVAVAATAAALANAIEVGGGIDAAGTVYFVAVTVTMAATVALSVVLLAGRPRWPGLVAAATVVGIINLERGGGVLVLLAWVPAAVAILRSSRVRS